MRKFIARICYAEKCRCQSTISYWIPRLNRYAYLCVKCGPLVLRGSRKLKADK